MDINWPLHNAQPRGAKLNGSSLSSPRNGSVMAVALLGSGGELVDDSLEPVGRAPVDVGEEQAGSGDAGAGDGIKPVTQRSCRLQQDRIPTRVAGGSVAKVGDLADHRTHRHAAVG